MNITQKLLKVTQKLLNVTFQLKKTLLTLGVLQRLLLLARLADDLDAAGVEHADIGTTPPEHLD